MCERNISWFLLTHPQRGTCPTTQACALTRSQTSYLLVHRPVLNPLSHTSQGCSPFKVSAPWFILTPSFTAKDTAVQNAVVTYVKLPYLLVIQLEPKFGPCDSHYSVFICQCDHLNCFLLML